MFRVDASVRKMKTVRDIDINLGDPNIGAPTTGVLRRAR